MAPPDTRIDDLYQLPLNQFTAARNALAKTLGGDQAAAIKRLEKPSLVPWAVNQLYWRERKTFDRLLASGRALRTAQIAALKGRSSDLRAATSAHRAVLADAVATATQLAAQSGAHPQAEPLSRMLEALSLAKEPPAHPGRLTEVLQPAGFEALAGVTPVAGPAPAAPTSSTSRRRSGVAATHAAGRPASPTARRGAASSPAAVAAAAAAERRRAEEAAAARKAAQAAVHTHERQLDRARAALARAEAHAGAIRQQLTAAERSLEQARADVSRAEEELARSQAALDRV